MTMIFEGFVTTLNADGSLHGTPMGPVFPDATATGSFASTLTLRPYEPSRTLENLQREGQAVFHIIDDVLLIARAALRLGTPLPPTRPARVVRGQVLADACRWLELTVLEHRATPPRHEFDCRIVHSGTGRSFPGFNRAQAAVLEATILATRVQWIPASQIAADMDRLANLVDKTAGPREREAWDVVKSYLADALPANLNRRESSRS